MYFNPSKLFVLSIGFAITTTGSAVSTAPSSAIDPQSLDTQINPCQDFYSYVDGKWMAANPIPADRTRWGTFDELREASLNAQHEIIENIAKTATKTKQSDISTKLSNFYISGMDAAAINKAGIAPLKPEFAKIDAIKDTQGISAYLSDVHARGIGQLFRFYENADYKNSNLVIGYAVQAGLSLPERDYYLNDKEDYKKIRDAYLAHIVRTLELTGTNTAKAKQQAEQILAFETRLAKASLGRIELRDPANKYHFVSLSEAEKITPHFSWRKFFDAQHIRNVDGFSLSQPAFFAEMEKMLIDISIDQWKAYLHFHMVDSVSPYLSDGLANEDFDFYGKTLHGQKEIKARWKRVLDSLEDGMGMALGELYVAKNFSPEAKQRASELVQNLRIAFKSRIEKLDWMSPETKQKALEKWNTFTPKIGYPDKWRDWSGLKTTTESYVGNVLAANQFDHDWAMSKIGKPVDRTEWGMTPQTVNAYYNAQQNEIVFPAAILQPPYFDAKIDAAVNYGGIGAVIGHEMSHGYDDHGSQFDAQGNLNNWWSKADKEAFDVRKNKLVDQFDNYVAIDDLHVKGKLTLGENIADLGGLNVAYDALQMALAKNPEEAKTKIDGLSQNQRFFINFARIWRSNIVPEAAKVLLNTDPHAPARFRAFAAASNMPTFAEAFSCKAGDAMVRDADKQVKIW